MHEPLKLVVYDATDTGAVIVPRITRDADGTAHGTGGLTRWWRIGAALHRVARADATLGARSWSEALEWATKVAREKNATIGELQAWGHGGFGYMGMHDSRLDRETMNGSLAREVDAFREVLAPDALVWLRCCSAFGSSAGRSFAPALADRLGSRVAGHTYIIGIWQSGTHSVAPGDRATWDVHEGVELRDGAVAGAKESASREPNTVSFMHPGLPAGW